MLILVTGGARSGKSHFAQEMAARTPGPHAYLATAQTLDEEMARRIEAHRKARPSEWAIIEEPWAVPEALRKAAGAARTVILDCVTLWMTNLILQDGHFDERRAAVAANELLDAAQSVAGATVIVVSNEVGSGVVPDNELARRFRDCAGRANQVIAAQADEVYLLASGIPIRIKPAVSESKGGGS